MCFSFILGLTKTSLKYLGSLYLINLSKIKTRHNPVLHLLKLNLSVPGIWLASTARFPLSQNRKQDIKHGQRRISDCAAVVSTTP